MKTIVSTNKVVNSDNLTPKGFTIKQKNLAKIINIVENDIYSDKILAVIREYSCNAYDANVAAGKRDVPIVVSLPSRLNPEFKVRDYGDGLTEEEIHEVYTSYGESTKENSNDYIGQLGIGSKSGFAYGDNFVVTSWKNGIKTVYNAVKGSEVREMVKLYSEISTEPSGIEVIIPVKTGDETAFKTKSINFFKYWQTIPKLIGLQDNDLPNINNNVIIEGDDWKICVTDGGYRTNSSIALMGNISYPIRWDLVVEALNKQNKIDVKKKEIIDFITVNNMFIRFQIGDLQISPSRESLQYTNHTINHIIEKVEKICNEIEQIVIEKISSANTLWQFKCNLNEVFSHTIVGGYTYHNYSNNYKYQKLQSFGKIFNLISSKLMFNGKNVHHAAYEGLNQWDSIRGFVDKNDPRYNLPNGQFVFTPCMSVYSKGRNNKLNRESVSHKNDYFKVIASNNNHIMIMDVNRRSHVKQAIKWYIDIYKVNYLYVLNFQNDDAKKAFDIAYNFDGATIVKFSDIFAKYKTLIPKRNVTVVQDNNTVKCGTLDPGCHFRYYSRNKLKTLWTEHEEIDLKNDSGYYMDISGGEEMVINGKKTIHPSYFISLINQLHQKKVLDLSKINRVCGFGKMIMNSKRFARNKHNWTNFVTYIENILRDMNKDMYVYNSILMNRSKNIDFNKFFIHKNFLGSITLMLPKDHTLTQFYSKYPTMPENIEYNTNILEQLNVDLITTDQHINIKNDVENQFNLIAAKYPMLKTLLANENYRKSSYQPSINSQLVVEIVNYINFIDNITEEV